MKPLTLDEAAAAVEGKLLLAEGGRVITGVSTDSRTVCENELFVPVKGENFDGHDFILSAIRRGAVCSISEREIEGVPMILVGDTKTALLKLAEHYRMKFTLPVVGITGSVGKTTTKDIIASVLSQKYNTLKNRGNFNNDIGLPRTVFELSDGHQAAVFEMGMNNFGEIRRLSKAARPDIAVITNIGVSHIENLGSRDGILEAKSEIFEFLSPDGVAVLNCDDDKLKNLSLKNIKTVWYGVENKKDFYADEITLSGLSGISCTIHAKGEAFEVFIPIPGRHMVYNALAAAAVGFELGLSKDEIKSGIENFQPTKMRMSITNAKNGAKIINDSYNANPVSMKAAIDVLAEEKGRRAVIIGDMLELGKNSKAMHYDIGMYCVKKGIDIIIAIGNESEYIFKGASENGAKNIWYFSSKEEFYKSGLKHITSETTVLVKASRSMGFEKITERLQGDESIE